MAAQKFLFAPLLEHIEMVCCTLLSSMIALALWFKRNVLLRPFHLHTNPLQWRLGNQADVAPPDKPRLSFWTLRVQSFRCAISGLGYLFQNEHNARIHAGAALIAVGAGATVGLSSPDWIVILQAIGLVLALEAMNTAVERLCDIVEPDRDPRIAIIKDVSAGAVLLGAAVAAACGIIVFWPYLMPAGADDVWQICRAPR